MPALFNIVWRRKWIVIWALLSTLTGAGATLSVIPRRYEASAQASIDPGQIDPVTGGPFIGNANAVGVFQGNMITLLRSRRVALDVVRKMHMTSDPAIIADFRASRAAGKVGIEQWLADTFRANVQGAFGDAAEQTYIMQVIYSAASPTYAATLANAFLASFIDAAIEMKTGFAQQGAQWYDPNITQARAALEEAQSALARAMQRSRSLPGPDDAEGAALVDANAALAEAKTRLATLESQAAGSPSAHVFSNEANVNDSRAVGELRDKLVETDSSIALKKRQLGQENPKLNSELQLRKSLVTEIEQKLSEQGAKLRQEIAMQKDRIRSLELNASNEMKTRIAAQTPHGELEMLTNDVRFRQEQLLALESAASEARLHSQMSFLNIVVMDKAVPPTEPAFPKPIVAWIESPGLGAILGLALAMLAEAFDRRIRLASDLEFALGAPVLARLPRQRRRGGAALAHVRARLAAMRHAWARGSRADAPNSSDLNGAGAPKGVGLRGRRRAPL